MDRFVGKVLASALALVSSASFAGTPCPPLRPGEPYPWTNNEFMTGDKWADMELDLDATGKVVGCRITKSNMSSEDGFFVCASMRVQGREQPVMKDGVAVPGTITSKMMMPGMRHQDADMAARKHWFREHPNERWDCYPE
jgi:hypothetical protein